MAREFWIQCPECDELFHAHYGEFRNSDTKLLCPTCGNRFLDSDAGIIKE